MLAGEILLLEKRRRYLASRRETSGSTAPMAGRRRGPEGARRRTSRARALQRGCKYRAKVKAGIYHFFRLWPSSDDGGPVRRFSAHIIELQG